MSNATINLDELEQLAKAATPGPWEMVDARAFLDDEDFEIRNSQHCIGYGTSGADAAYIVAACSTVPELIARIRELEAQNNQLLGVIGSMKNIMCERNSMVISLVTGLHQAMDRQVQEVMDKSLLAAIDAVQEELNK